MKRIFIFTIVTFLVFVYLSHAFSESDPETAVDQNHVSNNILLIKVDGVINPVSAEFIEDSINMANDNNYKAIIIKLDTPGGLDTSMRLIIKDINLSSIPVIVYVSPSGARAASAGVFITMAAHIAAMTPGTNIGAAHPVSMGQKMDKTMKEKATNDAVAYIKSIAEKRGRNAEWAEKAVRKSESVTEKEALSLGVIDIVANNLDDLLKKLNERKVKMEDGKEITIYTENVNIIEKDLTFRLKLLSVISHPNVAYILMLLGFYGLFFELTNPGSIVPGVIGGISIILAFYAFQVLPVNYAGLLLIILSIILFILEATIVSHGILALGGVISMTIGSFMLFESPSPFLKLSIYVILPSVIITTIFFVIILGLAIKAWKRKPVTGAEGLQGSTGIAKADIYKDGMVMVHGELWRAWSDEPIDNGKDVTIEEVVSMKIKVKEK